MIYLIYISNPISLGFGRRGSCCVELLCCLACREAKHGHLTAGQDISQNMSQGARMWKRLRPVSLGDLSLRDTGFIFTSTHVAPNDAKS